MSTPALLDAVGVGYTVIVRKTEYAAYVAAGTPKKRMMVVGAEHGLNAAREDARKTLAPGEWCLQMDDNVRGFIQPKRTFYKKFNEVPLEPGEQMVTRAKWQATMNEKVDFTAFYNLCVSDTLLTAEKRGAYLCGFSAHDNPAFRFRKFTDVGYVCGKMMLMRNQGLPWNQSTESSGEDYALTAAHLWENGRVLINKWGHPMRQHYQPGGCGPYLERLPAMLRAQTELSQRYGSLFRIKNANAPDKKQGELALRFNSLKQVEEWQAGLAGEMGKGFHDYDPNLLAKKGVR
jgi:hypothetical protein